MRSAVVAAGLLAACGGGGGGGDDTPSLTVASAIKAAGRDTSGKGAAFTNNYVNAARTGDFITGWSIGAYEQDN